MHLDLSYITTTRIMTSRLRMAFYGHGKPAWIIQMKNMKRHGKYRAWNFNGRLLWNSEYDNGKLISDERI